MTPFQMLSGLQVLLGTSIELTKIASDLHEQGHISDEELAALGQVSAESEGALEDAIARARRQEGL